MHRELPPLLAEEKILEQVTPEELDALLAAGWRHFGSTFFRYNLAMHGDQIACVQPLRVRVNEFALRKDQRRILAKNQDLIVNIRPPVLDDAHDGLFQRHKVRFQENVPDKLQDFLGPYPEVGPTECLEFAVYDSSHQLLAASWLDVGHKSVSSIYAMFHPEAAKRSLGIYTMLAELNYARENGKQFYYSGYSYDLPSPYDYKKRFGPLEIFDWAGHWLSTPNKSAELLKTYAPPD
jgi:arginine-tRNA-protein transferase